MKTIIGIALIVLGVAIIVWWHWDVIAKIIPFRRTPSRQTPASAESEDDEHEDDRDESVPTRSFRAYALMVNVLTVVLVSVTVLWIAGKIELGLENFLTSNIRKFKTDALTVNFWDGIPYLVAGASVLLISSWVFQFGRGIITCQIFEMIVTNDSFISHTESYGGKDGGWGFNPWWAKPVKPPISLKGETESHTPEGGCTTRDGLWDVTFGFVITPNPKRIFRYVERGAEEIEGEFRGIVSGLVTALMAGKGTMEILGQIDEIRRTIEVYFGSNGTKDDRILAFERSYGVDVDSFRVEKMRPAERTQRSLEDSFEADRIGEMVRKLQLSKEEGGGGLSEAQAAKIARMFGGEGDKATEQIVSIDMSPETAQAIASILGAVGNNPAAVGALVSRFAGGKSSGKPKQSGGH